MHQLHNTEPSASWFIDTASVALFDLPAILYLRGSRSMDFTACYNSRGACALKKTSLIYACHFDGSYSQK